MLRKFGYTGSSESWRIMIEDTVSLENLNTSPTKFKHNVVLEWYKSDA